MPKPLLLVLSIVGLVSIVPLLVWAATGSLREAWHALKGWLVAMGVLVVPTAALAALVSLAEWLARP